MNLKKIKDNNELRSKFEEFIEKSPKRLVKEIPYLINESEHKRLLDFISRDNALGNLEDIGQALKQLDAEDILMYFYDLYPEKAVKLMDNVKVTDEVVDELLKTVPGESILEELLQYLSSDEIKEFTEHIISMWDIEEEYEGDNYEFLKSLPHRDVVYEWMQFASSDKVKEFETHIKRSWDIEDSRKVIRAIADRAIWEDLIVWQISSGASTSEIFDMVQNFLESGEGSISYQSLISMIEDEFELPESLDDDLTDIVAHSKLDEDDVLGFINETLKTRDIANILKDRI